MRSPFIHSAKRVYVYQEPVHMGRSWKGLTQIVEEVMNRKVGSGEMFLFAGKKRDTVKILYCVNGKVCIHAEKLIAGQFDIPSRGTINVDTMGEVLNSIIDSSEIEVRAAA